MSTPIALTRIIEHHSGVLHSRDMKGLSIYYWDEKMSDHPSKSNGTPHRSSATKGKPRNWASGVWAGLGQNCVGSGRIRRPGVSAVPPEKKPRKILSLLFRKS